MSKRVENLLNELDQERGKFISSNEKVMQDIIDKLIESNVYPRNPTAAMKQYKYTILDMVKNYGVSWHLYKEPFVCINCNLNLRDLANGPPFKMEIAISDLFLDAVVDYVCPGCYCSLKNGRQYDKKEFQTIDEEIPSELVT